jgi:DNA-binding transcriptional MerR regulator
MVDKEGDEAAWLELVGELSGGADLQATWVPLSDAAAAAGVSRSALRTWYRSGQIPSRLEPGPHGPQRMVPRELVIERALHGRGQLRRQESATPREPPDLGVLLINTIAERDRRLEARIVELEARVEALIERAVAAETELQLWRQLRAH